jgi:hypothetical protein
MTPVRVTANLALGTGVFLTVCLSLALAALVFRLYSQVPQDIPPVLPGLILSVAMAAGAFLFLGLRLRQGRRIRPAAYQMTMSLVAVSVVVLVRQAARLFGAEWDVSGSALLGVSGLFVYTGGSLMQRPTRSALVEEEPPLVKEDLRAEVEALVREFQYEFRRLPAPSPPPRTMWQVFRDGFLRPARAFRELKVHPHLELCGMIFLGVFLWPRLTTLAPPGESVGFRVLGAIDYGLWILLYDLGKAAMFWGIARALGRSLSYASALAAFMLIDIPSLTTYIVEHLWPGQYVYGGTFVYSRLGLAPFFTHLAGPHPVLFDIIAKVDLHHIWTFLLWWVAVAILIEMKSWVALLVTMVTFPGAHIFAFCAYAFVYIVTWGEPSPFFQD